MHGIEERTGLAGRKTPGVCVSDEGLSIIPGQGIGREPPAGNQRTVRMETGALLGDGHEDRLYRFG